MGRPSKLTADTQERIAQGISLGATYELAAQYGGVSYNTFNEWMKRGKIEAERREKNSVKEGTVKWDNEQPYLEFYETIKEAEINAVIKWLAKIEKAASGGTWSAAAWKLERRYPHDYGRSVKEVTGKDGEPIKHEVKTELGNLSNSELEDIIEQDKRGK